jgi:hypothetical protein
MSAFRVPLGAWEAKVPRDKSLLNTRCSPAALIRFLSLFKLSLPSDSRQCIAQKSSDRALRFRKSTESILFA